MKTLKLTGWRDGMQTVSLIKAVKEHSTGSLAEAKKLVEDMLDGSPVTLSFESEERCEEFRRLASSLGAIVQ
jgi:ribosomal protein L7/L12